MAKSQRLSDLLRVYMMAVAAEGHSRRSIAIVAEAVRYFIQFLEEQGQPTEADKIGAMEMKAYILYPRQKHCYEGHHTTQPQQHGLSGHTINTYMRSIRAFFSWLKQEEYITGNPFDKVKVPRASHKVINTFTQPQLSALLGAIDTSTDEGYRDYVIILMLLDTGLRVSELCGLTLSNLNLEAGHARVTGKGNREWVVPLGRQLVRYLIRYLSKHRLEPAARIEQLVFLTKQGRPMHKDRVHRRMVIHGRWAGISGVRILPYTMRVQTEIVDIQINMAYSRLK